MSKDIDNQPLHMRHFLGNQTYCGVEINGYTIRYTYKLRNVTCKRCLSALKNQCQCPNCETIFRL